MLLRPGPWVWMIALASVLMLPATARADGDKVLGETLVKRGKGIYAAAFGVGLSGRRNAGGAVPVVQGEIEIKDLPAGAVIEHAFLYWITFAPTGSPTITLDGSVVDGKLIGTAGNTCWVGFENASNFVYRADVTSKVTGNGKKILTGFPSSQTADTRGASIFVVYSDPASDQAGTVHLHDGAEFLRSGESANGEFTTLVRPAVTLKASLFLASGDGQSEADDGAYRFDLKLLPLPKDDAGIDLEHFESRAGMYWDQSEHDVTSHMADLFKPEWSVSFSNDCLVFPYLALAFRSPANDYGDAGPTAPNGEDGGASSSSSSSSSGGTSSSSSGAAPGSSTDAGNVPVNGAAPDEESDGCGCRAANASQHLPFATLAIAAGLALRLRRRRR